ncbi:MAG: adenylyl-sulfate kinase [Acidobacteria bacterium]|nr:adenylyl-sulfate kinase [Acidobacteriota bacterium]
MSHDSELLSLVIVGHVDHGKSTILGRMLADTGSLPEGKLDFVREQCRRNSKPFEYAFLLDALKDEQAQGITIDAARCFFKTEKRDYIILDAPGHIEFLKNMVTGASRAEAALLVIDAKEGVRENSRRHGYLLSMLGIRQVAVVVNKMDLVSWDEQVFRDIEIEYSAFLNKIGVQPKSFIPVSGRDGDNVAEHSKKISWYRGETVLEQLDAFVPVRPSGSKPFRMPVQVVYKFTAGGDDRRIVAGSVESGQLLVGDEVIFYPSGKRSRVKSIEAFNRTSLPDSVSAGFATGFTMEEQVYIRRGELAARSGEMAPKVSRRLRVNLFWLGKKPLVTGRDYLLKIGSTKVRMRLSSTDRVIDASTLESVKRRDVRRHDVAECILELERAVAFDTASEIQETSRFVIVDDYEIRGGGIILDSLTDQTEDVRDKVFLRNYKWERSRIPRELRAEKLNQRPALILITGEKDSGKKPLAKALENVLFQAGRMVYFLGIGNLLYGVDADLKEQSKNFREEHIRRLAEVAHLMLDAGVILIVTAIEVNRADLRIMEAVLNSFEVHTVWIGEKVKTDIPVEIHLSEPEPESGAAKIKRYLQDAGIIFKPS